MAALLLLGGCPDTPPEPRAAALPGTVTAPEPPAPPPPPPPPDRRGIGVEPVQGREQVVLRPEGRVARLEGTGAPGVPTFHDLEVPPGHHLALWSHVPYGDLELALLSSEGATLRALSRLTTPVLWMGDAPATGRVRVVATGHGDTERPYALYFSATTSRDARFATPEAAGLGDAEMETLREVDWRGGPVLVLGSLPEGARGRPSARRGDAPYLRYALGDAEVRLHRTTGDGREPTGEPRGTCWNPELGNVTIYAAQEGLEEPGEASTEWFPVPDFRRSDGTPAAEGTPVRFRMSTDGGVMTLLDACQGARLLLSEPWHRAPSAG